jgi:hypothetical protein
MEVGRARVSAGEDEASKGLDRRVHRVDLCLEAVDLRLDDAQDHVGRGEILAGRGEVGAEVEQLVLDGAEGLAMALVREVKEGESYRAIGFVDVADRLGARMVLGDSRAVGEAGVAAVPGAGVDLVEPDQLSAFRWPSAAATPR